MQCFVYRSLKKAGLYVYLSEKDRLDMLPASLLDQVGQCEFALSFELGSDRGLASEDPAQVLANLNEHGYHVQMPKDIDSLLETLAHR